MRWWRTVALTRTTPSASGATRWTCRCDCGQEAIVLTNHLTSGATRSCGCLRQASARRTMGVINARRHGIDDHDVEVDDEPHNAAEGATT